ncbi:Peptidyl-prolyl cis-trans isomerase-like 4 [Emydomyces testavorans]|uniref:Peptidyl-prolyl cis-trans isomerase n=1 Tax=Emydomyces testavorans TaxID=2070801 RepID=A0AAF0DKI2_9EURO|nr:Peptidyl-prolyl cis-trans isomerase-like 4 [Emydomyces testavorans]
MSVLLETSLGDIVIDLFVDFAPKECENVQKSFSFQTGDPVGPGSPESDGGSSIWGVLNGPSQKVFPVDFAPKLKHTNRGTVSMATVPSPKDPDTRLAGSQFIITLGDNLDYLDGKAAIFGNVVEGFDVLEKVNDAFVDEKGRPLKDIRIKHTVILDDPFEDPAGLVVPPESPVPSKAQLATVMIADDEELDDNMDEESLEKLRREREARAQALTLEMVGDLPFAEVKPPENVLFVCKLNPVTQDEDLNLIFSRFGPILSCEVIRDKRTGDSLQYAFIEFENQKDCEQAYFKMQGVLIDDHRIHVDFSQSTAGAPPQMRKEQAKKVVSVAYPAWRRNATTERQMPLENQIVMEWYSIRKIFAKGLLPENPTRLHLDADREAEAQVEGIVALRLDDMTTKGDTGVVVHILGTTIGGTTMNDSEDNKDCSRL